MIFKRAINLCGLDRQEAADYLDYSLGAVKKWITGERELPDVVITKLTELNDLINKHATAIASELINNGTTIDDRTIRFLEDNLPDLPDLPFKGMKEVCLTRAILIVASEQLEKNKLKK